MNNGVTRIFCSSNTSFNKYFYEHKPLRALEDVAKDIVALEQQAEGLIADILGISVEKVQG